MTARVIEPLLEAAAVDAGMNVLDLATGPGYVAGRVAERQAVPVGIDVASAMVELARDLHPGLEFRQANAAELPFQNDTFDAVVGNFLILHVGEPERVASESARVLKAGGAIALSTWDVPERARIFGVMLDAIEAAEASPPADVPLGPPFFRFSSDDEFSGLLGCGGFAEIEIQTVEFRHTIFSADELWRGIVEGTVRTRALVAAQDEEVRRRIRHAFDERLRELRTNGEIDVPVSVKIASGRKPSA